MGDGVILRFLSVIRLDTFDYTNVIGFVVNFVASSLHHSGCDKCKLEAATEALISSSGVQ